MQRKAHDYIPHLRFRKGGDSDGRIGSSQVCKLLDGFGRETAYVVVDKFPTPQPVAPMEQGTVKISIDVCEEISELDRVGRIALEHCRITGAVTVAFQVAHRAIGSDRLEIPRKGMGHDARKQNLERLALLSKECVLEQKSIKAALSVVHWL